MQAPLQVSADFFYPCARSEGGASELRPPTPATERCLAPLRPSQSRTLVDISRRRTKAGPMRLHRPSPSPPTPQPVWTVGMCRYASPYHHPEQVFEPAA
jgi:hypothetical protein